LEAVAQHADEKEGNCEHPTICSDSLAIANPMDEVSEPTALRIYDLFEMKQCGFRSVVFVFADVPYRPGRGPWLRSKGGQISASESRRVGTSQWCIGFRLPPTPEDAFYDKSCNQRFRYFHTRPRE
ncbi:MAG: hypothetical protein WB614_08510, partial [Pseudolabrys sp.]